MLDQNSLSRLFRGSFSFFRVDPEELRRAIPDGDSFLPLPQRIFLEDEEATPLQGFPVLISQEIQDLRATLEEFLHAEEALQLAKVEGRSFNRKAYTAAWSEYESRLAKASDFAIRSSFGRRYSSIFWLYHSIAVSRLIKEIPRRVLRRNSEQGRLQGDEIKYRVFHRYFDRVLAVTQDISERLARDAVDEEMDHFPRLLTRMGDNVLILTEDHISPDLAELDSYFRGHLQLDGKDFRTRLERLAEWHRERTRADPRLRGTVRSLLGAEADEPFRSLLSRPGYLSFLADHPTYDGKRLLPPALVKVWESLLLKLKEFEILLALRRLIVPVRERDGALICRAPSPRGSGLIPREVTLSSSTRPMQFMNSWVVDPLVERFGLIYDITDFSSIVSLLRRAGSDEQDSSYLQVFQFQRWVNRLARSHRLQLEKYLGDGALYSGRHPEAHLAVAIRLQRRYRRAVEDGFPFDRGLRMALNYGPYRLLPVEEGSFGEARRYEFFGHGIVELSRLVTGKTMRDIDEMKTLLLGAGYPPDEVDRFFAPALTKRVDVVEKGEESRGFYCYINRNGALVNEGIVATQAFISNLAESCEGESLYLARQGQRSYVALVIEDANESLLVAVRKLGSVSLKGLGSQTVYEVVDGERLLAGGLQPLPEQGLLTVLDRQMVETMDASRVPIE